LAAVEATIGGLAQARRAAVDGVVMAGRKGKVGGAIVLAGACLLAGLTASSGAADGARGGAEGTVRVATTGNKSELVKTIPVGRRKGSKKRVVMSVQPGNLGELHSDDTLEATAEVEVSVCLKPNELHGSDRDCIGNMYGYDPTVIAELVLADGGEATGGARAVRLGREKLTCNQKQPNRNHHCVLVIDDGATTIKDAEALPCDPQTCHVNLVLSAHDKKAKGGEKVVVGAASSRKVKGDKGRVNVTRYRPGTQVLEPPLVTDARVRPTLGIAGQGGKVKAKAIYSIELGNLRLGEQLVIDGKVVSKIGQHPYNVFQTTGIVLSENRDSASREGWPERVGDLNGQIAEANGFNCTQGRSAHPNPCTARKVGVLEITRDSPKTLYVNLVAGMAAQADFNDRHRSSDVAKILKRGYLRVYRYPPDRNDAPPPPRD
jgi:hypothetical protein